MTPCGVAFPWLSICVTNGCTSIVGGAATPPPFTATTFTGMPVRTFAICCLI